MSTESQLAREIAQRRPFRSPSAEGIVGIIRTADIVKRRVEQVLEPRKITSQQYNVLRILRGAGPDGLHTLTIAERMIERAPGITRLLDRLESRNLVERERRSDDRRCVVCRLTKAGAKLLMELDAPMDAEDERMNDVLTARQWKDLNHMLDLLRASG
jgi:DNA-binding MarR family transcriptional regulator